MIRWFERLDFTGGRWLELGPLSIRFGPIALVERFYWRGEMVYADAEAHAAAARQRGIDRAVAILSCSDEDAMMRQMQKRAAALQADMERMRPQDPL